MVVTGTVPQVEPVPRPAGATHGRALGVFPLAMLSVAYIASLSGTPALAEYGYTSLFFYALAIVLLLIPTALVAAELATGWPRTGGVYAWASVAFGERGGFTTVWLQWMAGVIALPAIMSVISANASYVFNPALASNPVFLFGVIVVAIWLMTAVAMLGVRESASVTNAAVVMGIVIPGLALGILGLVYFLQGKPSQITFESSELVPDLGNIQTLVLASSAFLVFAGAEQSAAHAGDVARPGRDYPRAILLATGVVLVLIVPATLAIAIVVPSKELSLIGGLSQAFASMLGVCYPDVFKGGIYMIGCNFYREMTAPNTGGKVWHRGYAPPPADILIQAKKNVSHVLLTGQTDGNREQTKVYYELGFKRDGFQRVTYIEVPGMGHQPPNAEWFEKALKAMEAPPASPQTRPAKR